MVSRVLSRLDDMPAAMDVVDTLVARDANALTQIEMLALERAFAILSEASRHIPDELKAEYPDTPWRKIAGLGNILRHDYRRVEPLAVVSIATNDLPGLRLVLQNMLSQLEGRG